MLLIVWHHPGLVNLLWTSLLGSYLTDPVGKPRHQECFRVMSAAAPTLLLFLIPGACAVRISVGGRLAGGMRGRCSLSVWFDCRTVWSLCITGFPHTQPARSPHTVGSLSICKTWLCPSTLLAQVRMTGDTYCPRKRLVSLCCAMLPPDLLSALLHSVHSGLLYQHQEKVFDDLQLNTLHITCCCCTSTLGIVSNIREC